MASAQSIPFDQLQLGQSASVQHRLTRDDLLTLAAQMAACAPARLVSGFGTHALFHDFLAKGLWCNTLIAAVALGKLPGPGTQLLAENLQYAAPAAIGDIVRATLTVSEKQADGQVLLACHAEKLSGERMASGTLLVRAPAEPAQVREEDMEQHKPVAGRVHFQALLNLTSALSPARTAVVHPVDELSLRGAVEAARRTLIEPVLIGPAHRIRAAAQQAGIDIGAYDVIDVPHSHAAAARAVELAAAGEVEALMKGALHTEELMGAVLRSDGLKTERRVSHVWVVDVPTYPRLLLLTDAAINIAPDLSAKADIVRNAIDLAAALHIETPKVAILAATESVNPAMRATMDAAALCKMAERGQIEGGILDGPLAFDNAVSEEAAKLKFFPAFG